MSPEGAPSAPSRESGRKLCPKIILEGTRLTQKTEIAFALNEHPRLVGRRRYRYHSPLISAEWSAFTNEPWGRGLINFLPEEEELAMATYGAWARLFELLRYDSWIVDRFHLSTWMYQKHQHGLDLDFDWLEEKLVALGFRLVLCYRRPETFDKALEARLAVSGNPSQYSRGVGEFIEDQEHMRELVAASRLPALEVDVSEGDLAAVCDRVADWLEATGGLYQSGTHVTLPAEAG